MAQGGDDVSAKHGGDRSPTGDELEALGPSDLRKQLADMRARYLEAEAWLRKVREALGVESNAHAVDRARGLHKKQRLDELLSRMEKKERP